MEKILLFIPFIILLSACAKPAESKLPDLSNITTIDSEGSEFPITFYQSKLTPANSTLTNDDSSEIINVSIDAGEDDMSYGFEIGNPCYLKNLGSGLQEIVVKPGAYISSYNNNYKANRLIVDFYGGKGVNFEVYNNLTGEGTPLAYHESDVEPADPNDGGVVYEYAIDGNDWIIKNNTEFNKPAFYSISVVYSK